MQTTQFNLMLNLSMLVNNVEKFKEDEYFVFNRDAISVLAKPDELSHNNMAVESMKLAIANSGSYYMSPFSFNWNHHSQIFTVLAAMKSLTDSVSLSSCRVDALARDPGLAKAISYFGGSSKNLTCAIEGISERITTFLQKSLTNEELYVGINNVISEGFTSLKLYYIYTGLETDADIEEFEMFLQQLDTLRKKYNKPNMEIRVSFTPLLSTLGTPLQYHGSNVSRSMRIGSRALFRIGQLSRRYNIGVRLSASIPSSDTSQMMEFGDRRCQPLWTYASTNGLSSFKLTNSVFAKNPVKVTKEVYSKHKGPKANINGTYYLVDKVFKANFDKLYANINEQYLYSDITPVTLTKLLKENHGKVISKELFDIMPSRWKTVVEGTIVYTSEGDPVDLLYTHKATGKPVYGTTMNVAITHVNCDLLKTMLPAATNGQTFQDITADKEMIHILPNSHTRFHHNQHIGSLAQGHIKGLLLNFISYCFNGSSISECLKCGQCSNQFEVNSISGRREEYERGDSHFHLIPEADAKKNKNVGYKVVAEVEIDKGPYSAMTAQWLRFAINRAVLLASYDLEKEYGFNLVDAMMFERMNHSRRPFQVNNPAFRQTMCGVHLQEITFNTNYRLTEEYVARLTEAAQRHTTEGWRIKNLYLRDPEFMIRNIMNWAYVEIRFDSRRVKAPENMAQCVEMFKNPKFPMNYRFQKEVSRDVFRSITIDFDKSKVDHISYGMGSHQHETVLKFMYKIQDVHPVLFLAALAGYQSCGTSKPKNSGNYAGTDVVIRGFYNKPDTSSGDLFSLISSVDHTSEDAAHGTKCPRCNGTKFINALTSTPFGALPEEQNPVVLQQHGIVCHRCLSELTL